MKSVFITLVCGLLLVMPCAKAAIITLDAETTHDNGQRGIMFDITVGANEIKLTEISTFFYQGTTSTYEFYYIEGGMTGFENDAGAWTYHDNYSGLSGLTTQVSWDIADLFLNPNTTYGLYITNTSGGGINYLNASGISVIGADSNLTIYSGLGRAYAFSTQFAYRSFAGSLTYDTDTGRSSQNTDPVPAPAGLAFIALGLLALRRNR